MKTLHASLGLLLSLGPATAYAADGDGNGVSISFGDYFANGGAVMYLLLAISIVGVMVFLERAFDLFITMRLDAETFMSAVLQRVEGRQYAQALQLCSSQSQHPVLRVVKAGILRANRREKDVERAMEREMLGSLPRLGRRIGLLGLLANASTLAGLLGTIFGLIAAFNSVGMASAAERQQALAGGISQAMYTTAFGIAVALPLLFFHHFLAKRQDQIMMELEAAASAVMVAVAGERSQTQGMPATANDGLSTYQPNAG